MSTELHFQVRRFETLRVGMDGREIERWLLSQSSELLVYRLARGGTQWLCALTVFQSAPGPQAGRPGGRRRRAARDAAVSILA